MNEELKERDYVTLGLIGLYPQTGYELRKVIEEFVFLYPNIAFSQIYPSLHRILENEYVTVKEIEQGGRPNKKVYNITEEGLDVLKEWLIHPITDSGVPSENTFILKELFLPLIDKKEMKTIIDRQRTHIEAELKSTTDKYKHYQVMLKTSKLAGLAMVLELRNNNLQGQLEWLKSIEQKMG